MHNTLIEEAVDIFQCPKLDVRHSGVRIEITMGDLHGNAMKLIFMLVKHGIITNISTEDYDKFVDIYTTPIDELTAEHLKQFTDLLDKVQFNQGAFIRLLGDDLADRGNNDYFTLKIYEKLYKHQIPFEIIFSNHGAEFVVACELNKGFSNYLMSIEFVCSMEYMDSLIEKGLINKEEILGIVNEVYKPVLRAISYSLNVDKTEITIYSHAGIGTNTIRDLAKMFNLTYKDNEINDLVQTINNINEQFQKHLKNNTISKLYTVESYDAVVVRHANSDLAGTAFTFILCNEVYTSLTRNYQLNNYNICFVHGHDFRDLTDKNVYNLDNRLGKQNANEGKYNNKERYTVLSSPNTKITLTKETEKPTLKRPRSEENETKIDGERPTKLYKATPKNSSPFFSQKSINSDIDNDECRNLLAPK